MDITWFGHSCFRLGERGAVFVTDPTGDEWQYSRPRIRADAVTISHEHPGHNNRVGFRGGPRFFDGPGEYEVKGVFITGIAAFHDGRRGAARGRNTIYTFLFNDVTVCHLGDLGHVLSQEQVEALNDVDVLLVPVGGLHSLDAAQAAEVISLIEPRIVVPMHFKTPLERAKLASVEKFLKEMGLPSRSVQSDLRVTKSSLPDETQVLVLDYQS